MTRLLAAAGVLLLSPCAIGLVVFAWRSAGPGYVIVAAGLWGMFAAFRAGYLRRPTDAVLGSPDDGHDRYNSRGGGLL